MLTGLKVSSVACKFSKPGHHGIELNFEVLEMQKWNIPTDKAQNVDEKNGVLWLYIMFTPTVMVIIMSKITHF